MSCNSEIHDKLKILKEPICPFCDNILIEGDKVVEPCCIKPDIANKIGINVCINCGLAQSSSLVPEYVEFETFMLTIRRKSRYIRKYHIENLINTLCYENRVDLTTRQITQIYKVFEEIDEIIPTINKGRKRLISTKYIIKQIFMLLGIPFECIKITKSRKTLEFYNQYWKNILQLKNAEILHIIRQ